MLLHILIMALFTLFVGGIQFLVRHVKNKPLKDVLPGEEVQQVKKAV